MNPDVQGVRLQDVLYVLFKSGKILGAYGLARKACEEMLKLQLQADRKVHYVIFSKISNLSHFRKRFTESFSS